MSDKNEASVRAHDEYESVSLPDEAPFDVGEEIEVGDLSKIQSDIMPAAKGVLVEIRKAEVRNTKAMDVKYLNLQMVLPNGISTQNADGELVQRFVNKIIFNNSQDLVVWAGPTKTSDWYREGKHLRGIKEFWKALKLPMEDFSRHMSKENSRIAFCESLVGRRLLVNIKHENETEKNDATGKWEPTGEMKERYAGWKAAPQEAGQEAE